MLQGCGESKERVVAWVKMAGRAELKIGIKSRETRLGEKLTRRALGNHFNVATYTREGWGDPVLRWWVDIVRQ